jgi:hypothetical protein
MDGGIKRGHSGHGHGNSTVAREPERPGLFVTADSESRAESRRSPLPPVSHGNLNRARQ